MRRWRGEGTRSSIRNECEGDAPPAQAADHTREGGREGEGGGDGCEREREREREREVCCEEDHTNTHTPLALAVFL